MRESHACAQYDVDAISLVVLELGCQSVSPEQGLVMIKSFLKGQDVFVSLPTGMGKSLCYWVLPCRYFQQRRGKSGSIVVVLSPLRALMMDQIVTLTKKGATAVYVGEATSNADLQDKIYEAVEGRSRYQFNLCE